MSQAERAHELIHEICRDFPERRACSRDELGAQERLAEKLAALGVETRFERFRFNRNLYATIALHFGLALVGALVAPSVPILGALLLFVAGGSYWADASRNGYFLRAFLPKGDTQNLVATIPPADGQRRLRIVLPAHVDAAFTGWVFDPNTVRRAGGGRSGERQPYFARGLEVATDATFVLGLLALARVFGWVDGGWWRIVEWALTIPLAISFLVNLDVVRRDQVVPGAADNLGGVAVCMALIERFVAAPVEGVELVFVFTGAEEAGTGGAWALQRQHAKEWNIEDTVIIGVDTPCNGELRWFEEGEMDRIPLKPWLENVLRKVAAEDERFHRVRPFQIPVGASDAMPFVAQGYPGVTIGCTDVEYGAPRHYHHPNDRPENVDPAELALAMDFVEATVRAVGADRREFLDVDAG